MAFKSTGNAYCVVPTCLHSWPLYFLCFEFSEYLDESMLIPKNTSVLIHRAQDGLASDLSLHKSTIKWNMFKLKPAILMLLCRLQKNI
ncbi:unnamed protein product [Brassica oleracea]